MSRERSINTRLIDFSTRWKLDGDYIRCVKCKRNCIASRAWEPFVHAEGCKNRETAEKIPWLVLRELLADLPYMAPTNPFASRHAEQQGGFVSETTPGTEIRAHKDCICSVCGKEYWRHPHTGDRDWDGNPYLRKICDGLVVKL